MIRSMEFMPLPNPFPTGAILDDATTALIIGVLGVVGVLAATVSTLATYRRNERSRKHAIPLNDKLSRIMLLSTELSSLNQEVQSEVELQLASTKKLQEEARHAEALASLSEAQKNAAERMVAAQMGAALRKNERRDRWFQFVLSLVMFLLGAIASLVLPRLFADDSSGSDAWSRLGTFEQAAQVAFNML